MTERQKAEWPQKSTKEDHKQNREEREELTTARSPRAAEVSKEPRGAIREDRSSGFSSCVSPCEFFFCPFLFVLSVVFLCFLCFFAAILPLVFSADDPIRWVCACRDFASQRDSANGRERAPLHSQVTVGSVKLRARALFRVDRPHTRPLRILHPVTLASARFPLTRLPVARRTSSETRTRPPSVWPAVSGRLVPFPCPGVRGYSLPAVRCGTGVLYPRSPERDSARYSFPNPRGFHVEQESDKTVDRSTARSHHADGGLLQQRHAVRAGRQRRQQHRRLRRRQRQHRRDRAAAKRSPSAVRPPRRRTPKSLSSGPGPA